MLGLTSYTKCKKKLLLTFIHFATVFFIHKTSILIQFLIIAVI